MQESNLPAQHQLIDLENPLPSWNLKQKKAGKKLMITKEADTFMRSLNMYDKTQVYNEALKLASDGGYGWNSKGFKKEPMFTRQKMCPGGISFMYSVNPEMIVINRMQLELEPTGLRTPAKMQQMGLFEIKRTSDVRWHEGSDGNDINNLPNAWGSPIPVNTVNTEHVAINGMSNDLDKARWLMGVHVDTAYWSDNAKAYTLVYNPTRGKFDIFECIQDRVSTSKLAEFLAVMLIESQKKGVKRKWTAHSQGGIIMTRAVELVNMRGISLEGQRVSIHAGGNFKKRAENAFTKAGMTIDEIRRDHPDDFVPNLLGFNDLSPGSFIRCIRSARLVTGDKRPVEASPHTLPYIGRESAIRHLQMNGYHRKAERLAKLTMKEFDLL
ncbi:conserved hypothetical protein [Hahella chejuensis KCTC 2396]|uniref:Uncharacterized protein n=1 Tax=Hahella chejuensis (strain KCTC 2396) TaxID=349521 RepID=Q2SH28_HAHCH|nr:hypothetical protein [Hahella chejuensis]ABC30046.1 conserved hypothetical protein [Hahella chejuensis KCTC 2396]